MTTNGLEMRVSMERWKKGATSSADVLHDASITGYRYQDNKIWTRKLHMVRALQGVSYNAYTSNGSAPYNSILTAYNTSNVPDHFREVSTVLQFDNQGNPAETQLSGQDSYVSTIWDTLRNKKLATATCRLADIGYTGFESAIPNDPNSYTGNETITNGRFTYKQLGLYYATTPVNGKAVYRLNAASWIKTPQLTAGKEYVMTFWCNGTTSPVLSGVYGIQLEMAYSLPSGWKCYQARITPTQNAQITFTCSAAVYIDEIRLFPAGYQMQNWSYTPLWGPASQTDASGRIIYFEYDAFGRQTITRDQEGRIVSKKEIHTAQ